MSPHPPPGTGSIGDVVQHDGVLWFWSGNQWRSTDDVLARQHKPMDDAMFVNYDDQLHQRKPTDEQQ